MNAKEILFNQYLDGAITTEKEMELKAVSASVEEQMEKGTLDNTGLGEYELKARQAGFYAGFKACMDLIRQ